MVFFEWSVHFTCYICKHRQVQIFAIQHDHINVPRNFRCESCKEYVTARDLNTYAMIPEANPFNPPDQQPANPKHSPISWKVVFICPDCKSAGEIEFLADWKKNAQSRVFIPNNIHCGRCDKVHKIQMPPRAMLASELFDDD